MAKLIGAIKYRGSFKSIRNYKTLFDPNIYAGEKGGATREQILNNPIFARTRENMSEFKGALRAAKELRSGLLALIPEMTDRHLIGRLTQMAKNVQYRDFTGLPGKGSVLFSANRNLIQDFQLNIRNEAEPTKGVKVVATHPITRVEATLTVTDLILKPIFRPKGATHFRIVNHLSSISDWVYDETTRSFQPLGLNSGMEAVAYSPYTEVSAPLTATLLASFPAGTTLGDEITVIQCVGIEFSKEEGGVYSPLRGGGARIMDVF